MTHRVRALALVLLLVFSMAACGSDPGGVTVRFATPDGDFVVRIDDEASLARLDGARPGDHVGIPNGVLQRGDGGVNTGHDWHLVEVELADMTMEVCDGTAAYVDDLGYDRFLAEHGDRFCPWAATFVEIVG
jgi:hypothetical protein